jgi:hypothetical protein
VATVARVDSSLPFGAGEESWQDASQIPEGCPQRDHGPCFECDARGKELSDSVGEEDGMWFSQQETLSDGHPISSRRTQPNAQELEKLGFLVHMNSGRAQILCTAL